MEIEAETEHSIDSERVGIDWGESWTEGEAQRGTNMEVKTEEAYLMQSVEMRRGMRTGPPMNFHCCRN